MTRSDDLFHETLTLRTAFGNLVEFVCPRGTDAATVPLDDVLAELDDLGAHRFAAMIYLHRDADSIEEAVVIATELEAWLRAGRRPRTVIEAVSPEARREIEATFARKGEQGMRDADSR